MYKVTVENMSNASKLSNESFDCKKEANRFKRKQMKNYSLVNHGGYFVNYSDGIELFTNY